MVIKISTISITNSSFFTALWMFLLPLVVILIPIWLGQRYGLYVKKRSVAIHDGPLGSAVGATLGLLAFLLAFTFQIVGNRYDKRKELLLNEVSDIRTTFLYAGLLPEPFRANARKLVIQYVDVRVQLIHGQLEFEKGKLQSEQILDSLWSCSEALASQDRSSEAYSLFTSSISRLVSLFYERITVTMQIRLPPVILYVLAFVAIFSMIVLGYQFGLSGGVSPLVNILIGIAFSAVVWLIFALDRPEAGLIQIDRTPMIILQEQLHQR